MLKEIDGWGLLPWRGLFIEGEGTGDAGGGSGGGEGDAGGEGSGGEGDDGSGGGEGDIGKKQGILGGEGEDTKKIEGILGGDEGVKLFDKDGNPVDRDGKPIEKDAKKVEGEGDKKAEKDDKSGAPESYEDFTLPEGVQVDEGLQTEFKEWAKGKNFTQAEAQELVDMQTKAIESANAAHDAAFDKMSNDWRDEVQKDKEIGGANYDETVRLSRAGMAEFATDEVKKALVLTGYENHPDFVKMFKRLGEMISEGQIVPGGNKGRGNLTRAQRMYGTNNA